MEMVIDSLCRFSAYCGRQILYRGGCNGFDRLEVLHESLFACLAYTGDAVQPGGKGAALMLLVVIGDGEAMHFLLNTADHGEKMGALLNAQLLSLRRHQRAGPVFVIFYHAQNRQGQAQRGQSFLCRTGVHFAAVDQQQIRQMVELFVAVQIAAEAARQHFAHGGVVVGML